MAPSCFGVAHGSCEVMWRGTNCRVLLQQLTFRRRFASNFVLSTQETSVFSTRTCKTPIYIRPSTRKKGGHTRCQIIDTGSSENGRSSKHELEDLKGGTRLSRLVVSLWNMLVTHLGNAKRKAAVKIFSLLVGYYSANALSTLVGQTGDWDVIVVGLTVALMEGISFLVYRLPAFFSNFEGFLCLLNFWKVGLSLGFILDKFKLDSGLFDF